MSASAGPEVLVIGLDPHQVSGPWDPLPVAEAIRVGMERFRANGLRAESCLLGLDESDDIESTVIEALSRRSWAVVVVGGGIRKSEEHLLLFEQIINLVRLHAPDAAIAFNSRPDDTFDAAARWLDSV
jgi:hypothetical protein